MLFFDFKKPSTLARLTCCYLRSTSLVFVVLFLIGFDFLFLNDFLSNRTQIVGIGKSFSKLSDVIQGSDLTLFNTFVNDLDNLQSIVRFLNMLMKRTFSFSLLKIRCTLFNFVANYKKTSIIFVIGRISQECLWSWTNHFISHSVVLMLPPPIIFTVCRFPIKICF